MSWAKTNEGNKTEQGRLKAAIRTGQHGSDESSKQDSRARLKSRLKGNRLQAIRKSQKDEPGKGDKERDR